MSDEQAFHQFDPIDPNHKHSPVTLVDGAGDGIAGPAGADGADGEDGLDGATGPQGPTGSAGYDGLNGKDGIDGRDGAAGATGAAGKDAVLPSGLVLNGDPISPLFGTYDGSALRFISGTADVTFLSGYGAFAMPSGANGIASFHATLVDSAAPCGVKIPTDASAIGLLSSTDGSFKVAYLALIW